MPRTQTKRPARQTAAATTTVIDAGARYGMHPSWVSFPGAVRYFAFEPDREEAERLRRRSPGNGYEVIDCALADEEGERTLQITKHRGYSSFLPVDPESEWFKRYRPGEGARERSVRVKAVTVDRFAQRRGLDIDFLKVDTEGTELAVLRGAERQLAGSVLGIRANVSFQACYKGQALFQDLHAYVLSQRFFLANLDYFGRGVPRSGLFRNPDPLEPDRERYGVLIGTDAVWLREDAWIHERHAGDPQALATAILKYAAFCFANHAPDVGLDALQRFARSRPDPFAGALAGSALYTELRRAIAKFLGRWRVYQDAQWDLARSAFRDIFGLDLETGSKYWEFIQSL